MGYARSRVLMPDDLRAPREDQLTSAGRVAKHIRFAECSRRYTLTGQVNVHEIAQPRVVVLEPRKSIGVIRLQ